MIRESRLKRYIAIPGAAGKAAPGNNSLSSRVQKGPGGGHFDSLCLVQLLVVRKPQDVPEKTKLNADFLEHFTLQAQARTVFYETTRV
jgi:hypothetical protein